MAKKALTEGPKSRSGPRAPAGKRPLMVVMDEDVVKKAKIKAIEDDTNVSRVAEELLRGWLSGLYKLKQ
jgi:hypothetical protein